MTNWPHCLLRAAAVGAILLGARTAVHAQAVVNLRLEPYANRRQPLLLWSISPPDPGTTFLPDTVIRAEGRGSMRLRFAGPEPGYLHSAIAADSVRDAPLTIRARLRTADYRGTGTLYAFLNDASGAKLAEVNFVDFSALDSLPRTSDWHDVEIRLPAAGAAATSLGFGFRALGRGALWLDDVRVLLGSAARPYRDACMAENVMWLAERAPGAKVAVWAHNAHVAGQGIEAGRPLGQWLRATYGGAYVALGLTFAQGEYLAEGSTGFYSARAQPAEPGTYEAYFCATAASPGASLSTRVTPSGVVA